MFLELPKIWIAVLNVVMIPTIHLGVSWVFNQLPRSLFCSDSFWFSEKPGENSGRLYETVFGIRKWKNSVPDAGNWMPGGFSKNLQSTDPGYLRTFIQETCRGEAAHQFQLFGLLGILLIWNPWPVAAMVILVYAVVSNLPCILLQRHTRFRLIQFLHKISSHN